ncbi:MAG: helix-turn-helix domain-containing protein, partial [Acidimicrobiales bacterium]
MEFGATLRAARTSAGLSQRQLARRARTSQSRISSYESGSIMPETRTQHRLLQATRPLPSVALGRCREDVKRLAAEHHLLYVRVFGSVARGTDMLSSDIDLLVTPDDKASL